MQICFLSAHFFRGFVSVAYLVFAANVAVSHDI